MNTTASTRRLLRGARRAIPPRQQRRHAERVARILRSDRIYQGARRIAAYWPSDSELDPRPLVQAAIARGKVTYLPVLRRRFGPTHGESLWFVRFVPGQRLYPNRFKIPEPKARGRHLRLAQRLDLILVPLVGFDADANRIGMGGGYYDRTLAYLNARQHWRRPRLIGLAHDCQRLPRIEPAPWDVPLDAVVTEMRRYSRRPRSS